MFCDDNYCQFELCECNCENCYLEKYPMTEWQKEVLENKTNLTYFDWVETKMMND